MGSYLSTPEPAAPARPAQGAGCVPPGPLPRRRGTGAPPRRVVADAWRRLPAQPPLETVVVPNVSGPRESATERWHPSARRPPGTWSPVTVKIAPPERRQSPGASWRCSPVEERPDPCAKETVLQALGRCKKGERKFEGPLWFETAEPRPSAFKPLTKNGGAPSFVPRPGPLERRFCACSYNVCKEEVVPGPEVQPGGSAAPPAAGTASPQGADAQLDRWEKMQPPRGLGQSSRARESTRPKHLI
ncbi:hypothetical protein J1605_013438 [Eschrichtius robustus]|uniref:POM121-like protein 12 n=1 Tax=Eschrichtius robustus TaxID=9764 RepID=A0AB34GIX9_ESCRO|nr:hypothetical protein J1605_013438 [Eschrichtius robustus]